MKLIFLMCVCIATSVSARSLAQQRITMQLGETGLKAVFKEISRQTSKTVIYNDDLLKFDGKVRADFIDVELEEVLKQVLKDQRMSYKFMDDYILIVRQKDVPQTVSEITLKGTVVDQTGAALPGVTVLVKGTTLGTSTNIEGKFSLQLPETQNMVLVFSMIGMKSKEVPVGKQREFKITLTEEKSELEEVVVTGIVERKAESFTGSTVTMKNEDLKRVGNANVFQSLKSLDPSLMIFDNMEFGSDPNKNPKMTLRGASSIDMGTEDLDIKGTYANDPNAPLFILDGFEATVQKIMDLDMDRIASLTILKDASAKAIYGSRAANGVIVIETKQNESGDLRVTYTGSVTLEVPDLTSYNLTNAAQKLQLEKEFGLYEPTDMNGEDVSGKELYMSKYKAVYAGVNTDWLAKPLHMGTGQKHSLSIELGGRDLRVMTTFSYNHIVGVMKGSTRDTYDGSLQVSYRHKKFNFRNILNVTSNVANDSPYGTFSEYAAMNPYYSPYDKNGFLVKNAALSVDGLETTEFVANPLYNATLNTKIENRYLDVTDNLYVEWSVLQGLKATLRFGITEKRTSADEFYPANHLKFYNYTGDDLFRKGSYQANTGHMKKLSGDLNVRYSTVVKEKHYLFTNVGLNLSDETYEEIVHKAEGFPNDRMNDLMFAKQYVKDTKPSGKESTIRDIGILGIFNYTYDNKYLFDASYRANASSQFGANNRWGSFWSIGVGWNMHKEAFMNSEIFENFKIRGSLGYTGSQSQDAYASIPTYVYTLDRTYTGLLSSQLQGMKNDDLKWQRKMDYNVGFDMNIKRRFSLTFDAYRSITDNTLIDLTLPPSNGFTTLRENAGEVINRGFDIRTSYTILQNVKERSFLTVNLNISRNKNKLAKLSDAMNVYNESQNASVSGTAPAQLYYDGVSMNAIWAVRSLGIDPHNGREIYLSSRGLPTYNWSAADQVVLGDEMPKFQGTGGISFEWKGIGGNASFTFQYGAQMYNTTLVQKVENANLSDNVDARLFDGVWRPGEGGVKPYRAPRYRDPSTGNWVTPETKPTSRFVQDRNEFALTNLSLYYDFYRYEFLKRCGMERLRVSAYANNLFTISSIEIERGTSYPFARSFNFSLSVTF
ncbi:SusC/RagA family TonB-linked outer membrane protein [Odoribacter splanchnicus]|nr:SusC/RagA family TonB-linked outer membrane protein [Odoribacter splanchnicus]MDB9211431.1 SusC/RagA family TonB-linked outer membrane protein [Odoribacter splanchnicus]MDB9226831.1 SusC/RagA family TonB-linked outer membrane protein [Odoribacter splanchnicus]MDB9237563.1 SusC/RagA family TonB-linked outer membrane protein [Odoribacter splanchnicus]MDB9241520.1 SusC/RagA family TonB-linked outer membrane protein [Odoribacter splanchnicus]HJG20594.1 SusC/RagA family TonB-linked outer membran